MNFLFRTMMFTAVCTLSAGCVTTGAKPGDSNERENETQGSAKIIPTKDVLLAAIKLIPDYLYEWKDKHLDNYIQKEESSLFNPFKYPRNEFEKSAYQKRRTEVLKKLANEAEAFELGKEYKYVYRGGVTLGDYDFNAKAFPLPGMENFFLSFGSYYPDSLYIQYPDTFGQLLSISESDGKSIVERSYARKPSEHRKVFPVITYKLVSAQAGNKEYPANTEQRYRDKVDQIQQMDNIMNKALNKGGLPRQGKSSYNLEKARKQRNLESLQNGNYV